MSDLKTIYVSTVDQVEVLVLTDARTLPVDLEFMKGYMKVDHDEDDVLIQKLIKSAVEQAEKYTSRSLMPKTLKASFFGTEHWKQLPIVPVQSISVAKTIKSDGTEVIHDAADYQTIGGIEDKSIHTPIIMTTSAGRSIDHVEVTYLAGYKSTEIIPQVILEAIWQLVTLSYQQRDLMAGQCITITGNGSLKQKLYPYRKAWI